MSPAHPFGHYPDRLKQAPQKRAQKLSFLTLWLIIVVLASAYVNAIYSGQKLDIVAINIMFAIFFWVGPVVVMRSILEKGFFIGIDENGLLSSMLIITPIFILFAGTLLYQDKLSWIEAIVRLLSPFTALSVN